MTDQGKSWQWEAAVIIGVGLLIWGLSGLSPTSFDGCPGYSLTYRERGYITIGSGTIALGLLGIKRRP